MPTYTDADAVRLYVDPETVPLLPSDDGDLGELILKAEGDVDRVLSPRIEPDATSGRKLDPDGLTLAQQEALSRATAAAVEWRILVGEDSLAAADDGLEAAGSVRFSPPPRPPAPAMVEELAGFGFAWRSGLALSTEDVEEEAEAEP
ncbi:MAG: hypothetical protein R2725_07640 [Solirubrobacterales bacterium]